MGDKQIIKTTNTNVDKIRTDLTIASEMATVLFESKAFTGGLETIEDLKGAIILGNELGFSPATSVILGRKLNRQSAISIMRGRALGIDAMSAMQNIHIIGDTETIATGIHIITSVLIKAGTKIELLEDFVPQYKYTEVNTKGNELARGTDGKLSLGKSILKSDLTDKHVVFSAGGTNTFTAGQIPCFRNNNPFTYSTTVRMTRTVAGVENVIPITYSLQDAIDAGLYPGTKLDGTTSKGRDNWKNHTKTMLRNRTMAICGRIIAADILSNTYEFSELNSDDRAVQDNIIEVNTEEFKEEKKQEVIDITPNEDDK